MPPSSEKFPNVNALLSQTALISTSPFKGQNPTDRIVRLASSLKKHQDIIYRHENLSQYFGGDDELLHVATKCWQQIHARIGDVMQDKYHKALIEFEVLDKLSKLEALEKTHQSSSPAWRPSGNPREDFTEAAGAVIRLSAIPEFEKMYAEVQGVTSKLQDLIREKQQALAVLEAEISARVEQLNSSTET